MYLSPIPLVALRSEHPQNQPQPLFAAESLRKSRSPLSRRRPGGCAECENEFTLLLGNFKGVALFALAPSPALPFADETHNLRGPDFSRQEQVALEGQEDGRTFEVLGEGEDRRSDLAVRAEGEINGERIPTWLRRLVTDRQFPLGNSNVDQEVIRPGNCLFAQEASVSFEPASLNCLL